MVNTMVSCRFSLKPIHSHRFNRDEMVMIQINIRISRHSENPWEFSGPFPSRRGWKRLHENPQNPMWNIDFSCISILKTHHMNQFHPHFFLSPTSLSLTPPASTIGGWTLQSEQTDSGLVPPGRRWGQMRFALPWRVTCVPTPAWRPGEWRNPGWRMVKVV